MASNCRTGQESADSKILVLFFHELVSKSLPERGNGGQIGEIGVYVLWSLRTEGTITESIKTPFLPHFYILLHYSILWEICLPNASVSVYFLSDYLPYFGEITVFGGSL